MYNIYVSAYTYIFVFFMFIYKEESVYIYICVGRCLCFAPLLDKQASAKKVRKKFDGGITG